jgi:hypothetical protein
MVGGGEGCTEIPPPMIARFIWCEGAILEGIGIIIVKQEADEIGSPFVELYYVCFASQQLYWCSCTNHRLQDLLSRAPDASYREILILYATSYKYPR